MFKHCFACHRFCFHDPIPEPPRYSKDKEHVIPDRFVCVKCTAVSFGPDVPQEEIA